MSRRVALLPLVLLLSCARAPEPPAPLAPGQFAFGVFGDGPYRSWENARYRRLLEDVNTADLAWFLHVGDIFWFPCADRNYRDRFASMNSIAHPVVYTPGDNEWTDCRGSAAGGSVPLERLAHLRATFFANPRRSLGARPMPLETQADVPGFEEFVENALWVRGGFLFATVHMVGSDNATEKFRGRTAADDEAVARRTRAALAWMDSAFVLARRERRSGVVLAMHGDPGLSFTRVTPGYEEFMAALEAHVKAFPGPVVLIHGDSHVQRTDQRLRDRATGETLANFTRVETFGSPDIGWVRVVVDSTAGKIVAIEPRTMRGF